MTKEEYFKLCDEEFNSEFDKDEYKLNYTVHPLNSVTKINVDNNLMSDIYNKFLEIEETECNDWIKQFVCMSVVYQ